MKISFIQPSRNNLKYLKETRFAGEKKSTYCVVKGENKELSVALR